MNINDLRESRFIKKTDVESAVGATIDKTSQQNVAPEGQEPDKKWCLHFKETDKPMVLNSTNGQLIAQALGSDESDEWTGKKICLYFDRNVSFGGKLTGGIRARQYNNEPMIGNQPF